MVIIVGLLFGLALLYFWLVGHWFARILAFLVFGVTLFVAGAALVVPPSNIIAAVLGVVVAWFIAGLPTYYWRQRNRVFVEAPRRQVAI